MLSAHYYIFNLYTQFIFQRVRRRSCMCHTELLCATARTLFSHWFLGSTSSFALHFIGEHICEGKIEWEARRTAVSRSIFRSNAVTASLRFTFAFGRLRRLIRKDLRRNVVPIYVGHFSFVFDRRQRRRDANQTIRWKQKGKHHIRTVLRNELLKKSLCAAERMATIGWHTLPSTDFRGNRTKSTPKRVENREEAEEEEERTDRRRKKHCVKIIHTVWICELRKKYQNLFYFSLSGRNSVRHI